MKWLLYGFLSIISNLFFMNLVNFEINSAHSFQQTSLNISLISFSQTNLQATPPPPNSKAKNVSKDLIPKENNKKLIPLETSKNSSSSSIENYSRHTSNNKNLSPSHALHRESPKINTEVIYNTKYRRHSSPIYPRRALELGQQGKVILHVKIKSNGLPQQLKIFQSSGYTLLDIAAFEAVKTWEFEPVAIHDNTEKWVRVPINFIISK